MKKQIVVIMTVAALASCGTSNSKGLLTGNDRDVHGCIPSAGYSWSEVKKDCIQVFNDGTMVNDPKCPEGEATYAVFSQDSARAEIFTCYTKTNEILTRQGNTWKGHTMTLRNRNHNWELLH
jgi:hypothetical protein